MSKVEQIMALADNYAEEASMSDRSREPSHERERVEREKLRKAIEALAQPAQEAEPVAIYHGRCIIDCGEHGHHDIEMLKLIPAGSKLYTTPQQSQPLTDEQIADMCGDANRGFCIELDEYTKAVRDTEAAHNIKGVTE